MNKRSLAIFLPSLASGGAERVHINLAHGFIRNGWEITFVLQKAKGSLLYHVPEGARVVSLDASGTFGALLPLKRYLKQHKPDILLSNLGHNNIVAVWATMLAQSGTRLITTQHNTLSAESRSHGTWRFRILPFLTRIFLRRADAIVAVSNGVADDLAYTAALSRKRIQVIYNPIITEDFQLRMQETPEHPWLTEKVLPVLLGVGRLSKQKDFYTLISAFAIVIPQKPCRLIIAGEGQLLEALRVHAASLGVEQHISFTGFVPNVIPLIRHADLLVMSSRHEGFGNVLVESMACGTPIVSTNCPHGPAEILENGRYGELVPVGNASAMAEAIIRSLNIPRPAEQLQHRAKLYSVSNSSKDYLNLFNRLCTPASVNANYKTGSTPPLVRGD